VIAADKRQFNILTVTLTTLNKHRRDATSLQNNKHTLKLRRD